MTIERKVLAAADFKASGDTGAFRATLATLQVIDKDGDVTRPGAFVVGTPVKIMQWGHNWSALAVGKGVLGADDERAWVDGQFFLDTTAGKETYLTVKALGDLQEWSYGYTVGQASYGEQEGRSVRFLEKLNVFEASPVMIGAGVGTGTDSIKSGTAGMTLDDHTAAVLAANAEYVDRCKALVALRAKEGRTLSTANMARLKTHHEALVSVVTDLGALLEAVAPPKSADLVTLSAHDLIGLIAAGII